MKIFIKSVYVWLIILLSVGTIHAEDLKDGFMGTKWETDLSETTNFLKLNETDDVSYYINPTVKYMINDITISQLIYGTYSNKFFAVFVDIDTYELFSKMKEYLSEKYGSPKMTITINPDRTIHTWKHHEAKIKLKLNEESGEMKLAFYYTPLSTKLNEERLEAYQARPRRIRDRVDQERALETMERMRGRNWMR